MSESVYPQDFHSRIGFDSVLSDISHHLETQGGALLLEGIVFSGDGAVVLRGVGESAEMLAVLGSGVEFVGRGYVDIGDLVERLRVVGGYIDGEEIVRLAVGVEMGEGLLEFFEGEEREELYPYLCDRTRGVGSCIGVAVEARRIVNKFGVVRDGASPRLAEIRRELSGKSQQISRRLQQILQRAKGEGYADEDSSVSIRDGRAVIPIAAGYKRKVQGLIFDESATGKTAYIEPIEVIELNNEVRELQSAERIEVVRILVAFADRVRESLDDLERLGEYICWADFVLAKARYAQQIGGVRPLHAKGAELRYIRAQHPLLQKVFRAEGREGELVPLDIVLGGAENKPLLLISGPNAGGKSVCLKTVGLLQYMYQCGILPSVDGESVFGVFDSIFLDIGDQQSIDNDLSTYSSHLTNMKVMLRGVTDKSLILLDEFGAGTEPGVGGAIAEAILVDFVGRGVVGVITTHYANLKYFAAASSGIENGAMTFDVQRIRPLYRLQIGIAGNSYAFEIARKIGLPEGVLKVAEGLLGEDKLSLDKQLRDAQRDKRYWEGKRESIRVANKSAERLAVEYEGELEALRTERKKLLGEAKAEAARIVKDAGALIENTIREIKEASAEKERTRVIRRRVEQFKEELVQEEVVDENVERKIAQLKEREARRRKRSGERAEDAKRRAENPTSAMPKPKLQVVEGSEVQLDGAGTVGKVLSINSGGKAEVVFGALRSVVDVKRLRLSHNATQQRKITKNIPQQSSIGNVRIEKAMGFTTQLDIRGMRVVEGLEMLQQFIDEAIMLGQHRVTILHGKGTGALKQEVRNYLRSEPAVVSARDEAVEQGGAGITVVEF